MYIPKKYGHSKIDNCPFCGKHATTMNIQKVPVCSAHKEEALEDLKCTCGSILELLHGKFGVFFSCFKCDNINLRKALELNSVKPKSNNRLNNNDDIIYSEKSNTSGRKEITVRSDDPRYFG